LNKKEKNKEKRGKYRAPMTQEEKKRELKGYEIELIHMPTIRSRSPISRPFVYTPESCSHHMPYTIGGYDHDHDHDHTRIHLTRLKKERKPKPNPFQIRFSVRDHR